jgi:hypothetical protein
MVARDQAHASIRYLLNGSDIEQDAASVARTIFALPVPWAVRHGSRSSTGVVHVVVTRARTSLSQIFDDIEETILSMLFSTDVDWRERVGFEFGPPEQLLLLSFPEFLDFLDNVFPSHETLSIGGSSNDTIASPRVRVSLTASAPEDFMQATGESDLDPQTA